MKVSIYKHNFVKENMVTIVRGNKAYDRVVCSDCGLRGIRYGLDDTVSVKYDKACRKQLAQRVKITGEYVCHEFGFLMGGEYDRCECPEKDRARHGNAVWVYSKQRREPVRLLFNEYEEVR